MTPSMSRPDSRFGLTVKPSVSRRASAADWLSTCGVSSSSMSWYDHVASCRAAVTDGSFWRSEPAPELRGLA